MSAKILFPRGALVPYIEVYYLSSDSGQDALTTRFSAISTSCIKFSSVTAVVSGQATKPTTLGAEFGELVGLGVKLRPGAFHALFGIPACELTNQVIGLDEVLGRTATELIEQLAEEGDPAGRVRCLEQALIPFAQRSQRRESMIEQRVVAVMRQLPARPIAKLAEELGYSSRQLQRKLNNIVGLSPQLYQRLCRFERSLDLIHAAAGAKRINWSSIAHACGYSDQAHFIRDFHEFAGCTPSRYLTSSYVN